LAVKGKARGGMPTYRHLPLHPGVSDLIREVLDQMDQGHTSSSKLFQLYLQDARKRTSLSTKILNQILNTAAQAAGWASGPIFYALRHGFRTSMLSLGMDEENINYLMGHQIFGQPAFSIYHENHYQNLKQQYLDTAAEMTRLYDFNEVSGIHSPYESLNTL
jgi:site-specific recombinase XerD